MKLELILTGLSGQKARVKLSVLLSAHANRETILEHFSIRKEQIWLEKIGRGVVRQYEETIIYGMPLEEQLAWLKQGEKEGDSRAGQLWDWHKRVTSFEEMTNLPKSLIEELQEEEFTFPVLNERQTINRRNT